VLFHPCPRFCCAFVPCVTSIVQWARRSGRRRSPAGRANNGIGCVVRDGRQSRSEMKILHSSPRCIAAWICLVRAASTTFAAPSSRFAISGLTTDSAEKHCLACIDKLRGGDPYESNPNYQHSPTLGDVDKDGYYRGQASYQTPLRSNQRPPPLTQLISAYFAEIRNFSPTLYNGTVASLLLFLVWQLPSRHVSQTLRDHFVCSHYNVIGRKRFHALVTSAFSHASFHHLAVNVYAFLTFGRSVKHTLERHGISLWAFVISAALFGNSAFLAFDRGRNGSCIGLSGVTLALLAFDSLVYPSKELRLFVAFFPIVMPAYYLFLGLLCFSFAGIFGFAGRSSVAHSTHLGGLVYGALFFEAFKRGWLRLWSYRLRKAFGVR
ncbi:hypothetical protein ACHAWF_009114, partial [Thalassiosira exigua]